MQPAKILIASSSPPDRGAGINAYAVELSESLVSLGVEVHYLSPAPQDRSWLSHFGISHLAADQYSEPVAATREIIRYVAEHGIQGAVNNDNPFLQCAAPGLGCPLVVVGHMDRRSIGALACFQHEWVDHVVAISSDMQRAFVGRYGVPVTKCPIVYNGVRDLGSNLWGAVG